jgi:hypothetical protein
VLEAFGKAIGEGLNDGGEFVRSTGDLAGLEDIATVGQRISGPGQTPPDIKKLRDATGSGVLDARPSTYPSTAMPMSIPTDWVRG